MTSSNKRERDLARSKYDRQQQRRAERAVARRRRNRITAVVAGLVVVAATVGALALGARSSTDASPSASPPPSSSASGSPTASSSPSAGVCAQAPTPTVKTKTWAAAGGSALPTDKPTFLKLETNCGPIVISMDAKAAPKTTQSIAFLASEGFYTDSDCFRLTTSGIFVIQCGSPTNDGQGGPGYTVPDESLPTSATAGYPAGTVAMANAGAGTGGSQFFIVYKDGSTLGPNYTIWGKVVSGLDVITKVATQGVQGGGADGKPVQPIVITKATTSTDALAG